MSILNIVFVLLVDIEAGLLFLAVEHQLELIMIQLADLDNIRACCIAKHVRDGYETTIAFIVALGARTIEPQFDIYTRSDLRARARDGKTTSKCVGTLHIFVSRDLGKSTS